MSKRKETILSSKKVTVDFDGFKAVNEMDLSLEKGEIRFLIGPNEPAKRRCSTACAEKYGRAKAASRFVAKLN